jgi:hypothetical protein
VAAVDRGIAPVDGVLLHLPPPGRRRGARPVRSGAGGWLVALGGLVAALGLLLWARLAPLAGDGYAVAGIALFGLGGAVTVAGLALTMADRADRLSG